MTSHRHRIVGYVLGTVHLAIWMAVFLVATDKMMKYHAEALAMLLPIWFVAFTVLIFFSQWAIKQGMAAVRERRRARVKDEEADRRLALDEAGVPGNRAEE